MKTFSSLAAVMALWLGVSFLLWGCYRLFRRHDGSKQRRLLESAVALVDEGAAIFSALRTRASTRVTASGNYRTMPGQPEETLREDVRSLLNAIEEKSSYFDRVNAVKKNVQRTFGAPDFLALSEVLQIRRDFWAASEVFLMEGIRELGPELADTQSFETFQAEARALLFEEDSLAASEPGARDPVELRLAIAREDALAFKAQAERAIAEALEKQRFPTPAELVSVPWGLVKAVGLALREVRYLLGDVSATAQSLARAMSSKGLKGAVEELRQTRAKMPGQFASAFERAGGLARTGGQGLKRHYEFVLEAQELRARYAELLARAPHLSEKGKQFLARLELERRAEQFRETSAGLLDQARRALVVGIAYWIAGLQTVQAKLTPSQGKQLAPIVPAEAVAAAPAAAPLQEAEPEKPLRVLLLPASAYSGGVHGEAPVRPSRRRSRAEVQDSRPKAVAEEAILAEGPKEQARLRDLLTGGALGVSEDTLPPKPAVKSKPRKQKKPRVAYAEGLQKTSFKELLAQSGHEPDEDGLAEAVSFPAAAEDLSPAKTRRTGPSLLDRLSSLGPESAEAGPAEISANAVTDPPKAKGWRLPFGSKRK
jgi:hypothetical protein